MKKLVLLFLMAIVNSQLVGEPIESYTLTEDGKTLTLYDNNHEKIWSLTSSDTIYNITLLSDDEIQIKTEISLEKYNIKTGLHETLKRNKNSSEDLTHQYKWLNSNNDNYMLETSNKLYIPELEEKDNSWFGKIEAVIEPIKSRVKDSIKTCLPYAPFMAIIGLFGYTYWHAT